MMSCVNRVTRAFTARQLSARIPFARHNLRPFHSGFVARAMTVSIDLIKKLRQETDAPLGQCKKALEETSGDMEAAKLWLRKKGVQTAEKKSDRDASQGLVAVNLSEDRKHGIIVEMNSETDFVTRNSKFQILAAQIASAALEQLAREKSEGQFDLRSATLASGTTVSTAITELVGQVGENVVLRRWDSLSADTGRCFVYSYVHNEYFPDAGTLATLVLLRAKPQHQGGETTEESQQEEDQENMDKLGSQLAMHITGFHPKYITVDQVPAELVEQEKQILKEKNITEGKKPEHMDKIITGQLKKFYKDLVLLEQDWAMDNVTPVKKILDSAQMEVLGFLRYQCGEKLAAANAPVKE